MRDPDFKDFDVCVVDYASTLIERFSTIEEIMAEALKDHGRDFDVEVVVPGYGSVHRRVTWRRTVDETLTLDPVPVRIGLEEFAGDPSIGARLGGRLAAAHPRFKITDGALRPAPRLDPGAGWPFLSRPSVQGARAPTGGDPRLGYPPPARRAA